MSFIDRKSLQVGLQSPTSQCEKQHRFCLAVARRLDCLTLLYSLIKLPGIILEISLLEHTLQ
jgi:hypothetical protein